MATTLQSPPAIVDAPIRFRAEPPPPPQPPKPERLVSLDAFRGFIMTALAAHAFGLADASGESGFGWLVNQFHHVEWEGMVFWDLIQPAFLFMVGLAMPFSFANRRLSGQTAGQVWRHVAWRAVSLIVISQVIMSISRGELHFQLINVLSQIGLAYVVCYGIMQLDFKKQVAAAALILAGHWALFVIFPGSEGAFSRADNVGARIDHFFGLEYGGFYVTLNFLSSAVSMMFGVWAGYLMRQERSDGYRIKVLAGAALACFASGFALSLINPMVKRLWTASFALASSGCVLLILLGFYWLVEVKGYRKLMFPLVVVGMNSIFIYCLHIVLHRWLNDAVGVFTGGYSFLGALAPVAQATTIFLVMWYWCYWLYQRKIFLRV